MKKVLSIPGQMLISGVMSGIAMEVVAFLAGKREDGFHAAPLASQIPKMSMKTTLPLTLILLTSAWGALAQAPVLDDAQIAAVVIDANLIDIEVGKLAQFKSKEPEVQFFAQRMVTDHAVARDSATELTTRLKLIPQENSISRNLKANGKENLEKLKPLRRAAFDKAYIDHEVAYHVQVLGIIDQTLIPGAKDERLKHLLAKIRPAFFSHLEHAQRLQESVHQKNP